MADLAGAVDLSGAGKTLGPREAEALQSELRMMAQTRELALRRQVELEAENEGLSRAVSAVVHVFGDDLSGAKILAVHEADFEECREHVASFSMQPDGPYLRLENIYKREGRWNVTGTEPDEAQARFLPVHESLPEVVTYIGDEPPTVIVQTKKGLRIAEWQPA